MIDRGSESGGGSAITKNAFIDLADTIVSVRKRAQAARAEYFRNKRYLMFSGLAAIAALLLVNVASETVVRSSAADAADKRLEAAKDEAKDAAERLASAKAAEAKAVQEHENGRKALAAAEAVVEGLRRELGASSSRRSIEKLWVSSDGSSGWAVGSKGEVLRVENGQWSRDASASALTSKRLYGLWLDSSGSSGWAVGNNGEVLRVENGQWSRDELASTAVSSARRNAEQQLSDATEELDKARSETATLAEKASRTSSEAKTTAEASTLAAERAKGAAAAIAALSKAESSPAELATRGGAILGAIGLTIFLMQILLSSMRYYARLAEHYDAQADALTASAGVYEHAIPLLEALSPVAIEFGKMPTHIFTKVLDTIGRRGERGRESL